VEQVAENVGQGCRKEGGCWEKGVEGWSILGAAGEWTSEQGCPWADSGQIQGEEQSEGEADPSGRSI
jgi:hypothetical protein